jgi:hypothetical protein
MAEFNSPVDSSFVFVGTDQSQVLPLSRPPTVTSDTTFPSSISTPTSPIDSNVSSVGTLEVPNHSFLPLHLTTRVHFSQYTILRLIRPMSWDLFHPMHTIGPVIRLVEYSHTAGISSTRMAAFATFVG